MLYYIIFNFYHVKENLSFTYDLHHEIRMQSKCKREIVSAN